MRFNALYWAILINSAWYLTCLVLILVQPYTEQKGIRFVINLIIDGIGFWELNLFAPLLIVILRFNYLLYKNKDEYIIKPIKLLPNKYYRFLGEVSTFLLVIVIAALYVSSNVDLGGLLLLTLPLTMLPWVFSKQKQEDEYVNTVRLHAMQWAIYANYIILLIANMCLFSLDFLFVMMLNTVTIPVMFLIVFHWRLYKLKQDDKSSNLNLNLL